MWPTPLLETGYLLSQLCDFRVSSKILTEKNYHKMNSGQTNNLRKRKREDIRIIVNKEDSDIYSQVYDGFYLLFLIKNQHDQINIKRILVLEKAQGREGDRK